MAEYISRSKAEYELCEGNIPEPYKSFCRRVINDRNLIPAADVAPVVPCKDCKNWNTTGCALDYAMFEPTDDSFCSYGERKDGDGNG